MIYEDTNVMSENLIPNLHMPLEYYSKMASQKYYHLQTFEMLMLYIFYKVSYFTLPSGQH